MYANLLASCLGRLVIEMSIGCRLWAENVGDVLDLRCDLREQRQPLRSNRLLQISKASNVAARMGQTLNEALVDGFGDKDASPKLRRTS